MSFGGPEAAADEAAARVLILPVAYEGTVSYGAGTAAGPRAILDASTQIELYDEQLDDEPFRVGIHTAPCWTPAADLDPEAVVLGVEERVGAGLDAGRWVLTLGGEHSLTVGAVRAAARRHPGLVVVQLDAHADLRERYEGTPFNHACAMARCLEVAEVRALGLRSYSDEERRRIADGLEGWSAVHAWEMEDPEKIAGLLAGIDGRPVYLTVDVDFFDPSLVPATGTPEPGGGGWYPTLAILAELFRRARVVAADVVELAPIPGLHHADFTVARLAYKLIGLHRRALERG